MRRKRTVGAMVVLLASAGCAGTSGPTDAPEVSRETLPGGAVLVRYSSLPPAPTSVQEADVRLGAVEGEPHEVFGDVRGIDVAGDGTIYVLDYQASEVRAFAPDGGYVETVAGRGEGPGEISEANGMVLRGDSILWIQDHGKWMMLALARDGTEYRRIPMPVRNYSYMWNGTVDEQGVIWKSESHSDEPRAADPDPGFNEGARREYVVSYDTDTERRDSLYLGDQTYVSYVRIYGNGRSFRGVPHLPQLRRVVDPDGGVWAVHDEHYRIVRFDASGDSTVVVQVDVPGPPVTDQDRREYVAESVGRDEEGRAAAEAIAERMPERKPAIAGLHVDDQGRLWVRSASPDERGTRYDLFDREGSHVGAVVVAFTPSEWLAPTVRDGRIYALVTDEFDVPYVVGATTGY